MSERSEIPGPVWVIIGLFVGIVSAFLGYIKPTEYNAFFKLMVYVGLGMILFGVFKIKTAEVRFRQRVEERKSQRHMRGDMEVDIDMYENRRRHQAANNAGLQSGHGSYNHHGTTQTNHQGHHRHQTHSQNHHHAQQSQSSTHSNVGQGHAMHNRGSHSAHHASRPSHITSGERKCRHCGVPLLKNHRRCPICGVSN